MGTSDESVDFFDTTRGVVYHASDNTVCYVRLKGDGKQHHDVCFHLNLEFSVAAIALLQQGKENLGYEDSQLPDVAGRGMIRLEEAREGVAFIFNLEVEGDSEVGRRYHAIDVAIGQGP